MRVMLLDKLRLLIPRCFRDRLPSWPRSDSFFVEGESECTSERALGQFSIFGAVEENGCRGFYGSTGIKNFFRNVAVSRLEGLSSVCAGARGESFGRVGQRIVHRGCTGNAERQWSVGSGRFTVAGFVENHTSRRCSNCFGAALIAPQ
jgi:hypothetical protein